MFGGGDHAFTFRARSHEEMMEVWNDLRMLVARYLVASEQMERDGPVAHAVRSVGYVHFCIFKDFANLSATTLRMKRTRRMTRRRVPPSRRPSTTESYTRMTRSTRRLPSTMPTRLPPTKVLLLALPSRSDPTVTP